MSERVVSLQSGSLTLTVSIPGSAGEHDAGRMTAGDVDAAVVESCRRALAAPLEFPLLAQCVVPGDSVVVAVDPEVPALSEQLALIAEQLQGVADGGVRMTVLLPDDPSGSGWTELIESWPLHLREQVTVVIHDPQNPKQLSYLASSAAGDRLYLNTALVDADLIVSLGLLCHDSTIGIRGTTSGLFPVFSDVASRAKFVSSDDSRMTQSAAELRQLIDEVGWLLGTQFTMQVLPAVAELPASVVCGAVDAVLQWGRDQLAERGVIRREEPASTVVVSVAASRGLEWKQLGTALAQARRVVEDGGRIIAVADVSGSSGPAMTMLRQTQDPAALLRPLHQEPVPDGVEVSQLIEATEQARVFLHSRLPDEVVEELRMMPVSNAAELQRLIASCGPDVVVIAGANYARCELVQPRGRRTTVRSGAV